jgi:hypothetical protein
MRISKTLRGVGLATALAIGLLLSITGAALAATTPGWECVPTTAGQAVVSGGTGTAPSCSTGATAVLAPTYVASGANGKPTVQLSAVNLQVINGSGSETTVNGTGNLILGYDEAPGAQTGSHNLILGTTGQADTSYGGILGGYANTISGPYTSVLGGGHGSASAFADTITGGLANTASTEFSNISGGCSNYAGTGTLPKLNSSCTSSSFTGDFASILGGTGNQASAQNSTVSGGSGGEASGVDASVTGGRLGKATFRASTVLGGLEEVTEAEFGVTP